MLATGGFKTPSTKKPLGIAMWASVALSSEFWWFVIAIV